MCFINGNYGIFLTLVNEKDRYKRGLTPYLLSDYFPTVAYPSLKILD